MHVDKLAVVKNNQEKYWCDVRDKSHDMSGTCLDMSNVKLIHLGSFWIKAVWGATRDKFHPELESTRCVSSPPSTERASPHYATPWLRPNPWRWWQLPRLWQQSRPLTLGDRGIFCTTCLTDRGEWLVNGRRHVGLQCAGIQTWLLSAGLDHKRHMWGSLITDAATNWYPF